MKQLLKKITLEPITFGNRLFFHIYFWVVRKRFELLPVEDLQNQRILVVAPHVDDEVIGCGGLLFNLVERENIVKCLYLTNGAGSYHPKLTKEELVKLRRNEGHQVARFYGLEPPSFLNLEDGAVKLTAAAVKKVKTELQQFAPQIVFLPHFLDGHRDHVMATGLGLATLEESGFEKSFPLYLYQSSSPLTYLGANRFFPLKREFEGKRKALKIFKSQTMPFSGLLTLDYCRKAALDGDKDKIKKVCGAEFFWKGSLGECKKIFESYGAKMAPKVRPMSSPYFLIRDYFSGWRYKKEIGKMLANTKNSKP